MLKKIKCPSCGASLKPDSYYCDYCGAFFEKENKLEEEQLKRFEPSIKIEKAEQQPEIEEDLYKEDNFVSTEEIENSRLNSILIQYANIKENHFMSGLFWVILIFFFFIMGSALEIPFISILSIFFAISFFRDGKEKRMELTRLYQKGSYSSAYQILLANKYGVEQIKVIKQKIMLCYYRLDKKEEAKILIQNLNNKIHSKDEHIKEVAEKLGVIYSPKSV